jgi:transcriptional regulator with XRE-family HTH domain
MTVISSERSTAMEMGRVIAKLRNDNHLSQKQLARELNVSTSLIGMWESNRRMPSLETFISIIDYFSISADVLMDSERKLAPNEYRCNTTIPPEFHKIIHTYSKLNEDNQDILIGEAKKLLKEQSAKNQSPLSEQRRTERSIS